MTRQTKVKIEPTPKSVQELQWARVGRYAFHAKSADGVREYTVKATNSKDVDDTINLWGLAWRVNPESETEFSTTTFLTHSEAQEIAQNIENSCELNHEALQDVAAGNAVTVGGNNWRYYGIHNNKRLWVCVLPGDRMAYVATSNYGSKKWTVSKREWVYRESSGSADEPRESDVEELKITIVGRFKNLTEAQMSVARLEFVGSNHEPTT